MKGKIIASNLDLETKIATVTKQTKYGTFTCSAKPTKEDLDFFSPLLGYTLAEYKCDILAEKAKANMFNQRCEGVRHAIDNMSWQLENKNKRDNDGWVECFQELLQQFSYAHRLYKEQYEKYLRLKEGYDKYAAESIEALKVIRKSK